MDQPSQSSGSAPQPEQPHQTGAAQQVPTQALPSGDLTSTHKLVACLSYFIFFLPIFFEKEKHHPFVVLHMNQAFGVFLIHIVNLVVANIPVIGMFAFIISILNLILVIMGIINAVNGSMKKLPVVGEIDVFKAK